MKNYIVFMCAILALFAAAKADECKYNDRTLKVGESYQEPGTCALITCKGPNQTFGEACATVNSLRPRKRVEDRSKPYPDCCPRFVD